ncbi:MAG: tetratricopeptide repeat protein [Pseudobdellovibrio sp.]
MKNIFLAFTLSLTLSSCSSDPVKPNETAPVKKTEVKVEVPLVKVEKKPEPEIKANRYAELDAAIAASNDDKIRVSASELLLSNARDTRALNALAMYYYKNKQLGAANLLINKSLAVNPKSAATYNNLGLLELASDNKYEAVNAFRKALELDPENYFSAFNVASIYAQEKDYNKVIFSLEKAIKNDKADVNSLSNYGMALAATGKTQEASDTYEKILKNNPDHKSTMLNFSILMIEKQDKFKEGLDLINRLKFVGVPNESREVIKELEIKAKAGLK